MLLYSQEQEQNSKNEEIQQPPKAETKQKQRKKTKIGRKAKFVYPMFPYYVNQQPCIVEVPCYVLPAQQYSPYNVNSYIPKNVQYIQSTPLPPYATQEVPMVQQVQNAFYPTAVPIEEYTSINNQCALGAFNIINRGSLPSISAVPF